MSVPEFWLRGAIPDIAPLLQPVAHSLMQSQEEMSRVVSLLTPEEIRTRPGGAASIGFHARHAAGALDRLFTYARGESLSSAQNEALIAEKRDAESESGAQLVGVFSAAVDRALDQLRTTPDSALLDARAVGRAQLPSTVLGLLFHAAEHTLRHVGQLMTTAKVVRGIGP